MRNILSLFCLISVLIAMGCASESIHLQSIESTPFKAASPAGIARGVKLAVSDFSLATGKPARTVGEAKTGMFNIATPVVVDQPVNALVKDAVANGLNAAGVMLLSPSEADFRVDGTVEKLWVDEYATGWSMEYAKAHVKFEIYVHNSKGDIVWAKSLEQFKASGKSADATADDLPTLKLALEEAVRLFIEDAGFWQAISK